MRFVFSSSVLFLSAAATLSLTQGSAEIQTITQWQEPSIADLVPNDSGKPKASNVPFQSFTGRITRNKVRMRLQPSLESPIIRELNRDDLFVVDGEVDEFYSIRPPSDIKGYIYRTFILDNVIEGSKVNVRLEPDLDSPVLAQLNGGTKIQGTISPLNSKWMEIAAPNTVRFYICKEYVEKKGPPSLVESTVKRREEVATLFQQALASSQIEMQKRYEDMNPSPILASLNTIVAQYADFPEEVEKSRAVSQKLQENYLQKKVAYLEAKQNGGDKSTGAPIAAISPTPSQKARQFATNYRGQPITDKMAQWVPIEQALYEAWTTENGPISMNKYYEKQAEEAVTVTGIIEPYSRSVKNKPGDFVLLNQSNRLPIAYLYSTEIDLHNHVGQAASLQASPRPNNHFAYPAYYVISLQ